MPVRSPEASASLASGINPSLLHLCPRTHLLSTTEGLCSFGYPFPVLCHSSNSIYHHFSTPASLLTPHLSLGAFLSALFRAKLLKELSLRRLLLHLLPTTLFSSHFSTENGFVMLLKGIWLLLLETRDTVLCLPVWSLSSICHSWDPFFLQAPLLVQWHHSLHVLLIGLCSFCSPLQAPALKQSLWHMNWLTHPRHSPWALFSSLSIPPS